MDIFLTLFFIVFAAIFIGLFVLVIRPIVNAVAEKRYNDSQPVLTKDVTISAKRTAVSGGIGDSAVRTFYFATFEFDDNKERAEFRIPSNDYGLMAEDDAGKLTFQGRRYLGFARNI